MRHIQKLTALAICAALVLSGCSGNNDPAGSETTPAETTTSTAAVQTEEITTTTTTASVTAEAETTETEPPETTVSETTAADTTTTAATTLGGMVVSETTSQTTTAETTAANPAVTDDVTPPPEIDKDMFTLYLGGNTTPEKYNVKIDSLPADIVSELVRTLPEKDASLTIDSNGKYTVSEEFDIPDSAIVETFKEMLKEETYESVKEYFKDTEYEGLTYEEYRESMLEDLEKLYPGIRDMIEGNVAVQKEYSENIHITYRNAGNDSCVFADETVIKEGLKAITDELEANGEYRDMRQKAKKDNDFISVDASIRYDGGYVLSYSANNTSGSGRVRINGEIYLGDAKIYETDPDTTTHYVIPADSPLLRDINTSDNPYEMSLDIVADGYYGDTIYIDESGYSYAMSNDAILGMIPEIEIGDFGTEQDEKLKQVWVKFMIKEPYRDNVLGTYAEKEPELEGIKRLYFFMFDDEINVTVPVATYFDEQNFTVYTVTDIGGTYCLYDLELWFDMFGVEP